MADIGVLLLGLFLGGLLSFYFAKRQELYRLRLETYKEYIEGIIAKKSPKISVHKYYPEGSGGDIPDGEKELNRKLLEIEVEKQNKQANKKIEMSMNKIAVLGGKKTIKAIIDSTKQRKGSIEMPEPHLDIEDVIKAMRKEIGVGTVNNKELDKYLKIRI